MSLWSFALKNSPSFLSNQTSTQRQSRSARAPLVYCIFLLCFDWLEWLLGLVLRHSIASCSIHKRERERVLFCLQTVVIVSWVETHLIPEIAGRVYFGNWKMSELFRRIFLACFPLHMIISNKHTCSCSRTVSLSHTQNILEIC